MKANIFTERKGYQAFIIKYLKENNGFVVRNSKKCYDASFGIDRELLFQFLERTQKDKIEGLKKQFGYDFEEIFINSLNQEMEKERGSKIDILKDGFQIGNTKLQLFYPKPENSFNKEILQKYNENIFSVMEEVYASPKERVDLVIFLNGISIIAFELKCNFSGQNFEDAIKQFRMERDPKTKLFRFKSGVLVSFAMDLDEIYMTTKLDKESTYFLPFNKGKGYGIDMGAGNNAVKDGEVDKYGNPKFPVSYMWEDILTKDTLQELISKFIFFECIEEEDNQTKKKKIKKSIIFPRYHQLDVLRKLEEDIKVNESAKNYLIQHSAGSGKTYTIAWLAHRLATLHNLKDELIFTNIIIVTDRIVVDRQLQEAVMSVKHKSGFIKVMNEDCSSLDLAKALGFCIDNKTGEITQTKGVKVIATTIQKFPYVLERIKGEQVKGKRFAVIIDEAHSSTAGKNMLAMRETLAEGREEADEEEDNLQDEIVKNIIKSGKISNISFFAFTATPKPTTIEYFGTENKNGQKEAFHLYSMKQAVEEGFILDVLTNYTIYETFYKVNKEISNDPKYATAKAKRKIAELAKINSENIEQRIAIVVEHFRENVMSELDGTAKAMLVMSSRKEAVLYYKAFNDYIEKNKYTDMKALVAFSGKLILDDGEEEFSEYSLNKIKEDRLAKVFDTDEYNFLIVANKYQTGFSQKRLSAMYVFKKLSGISAVQTLSRLNRICPPYEKKIFVLDFVNDDYQNIKNSFAPYYTGTILGTSVTKNAIYELDRQVDATLVLDLDDVERTFDILQNEALSGYEKATKIKRFLGIAQKVFEKFAEEDRKSALKIFKKFIRFYEFLTQVSYFEDMEIYKKYIFLTYLVKQLDISTSGTGFDLVGKVNISNFVQKKIKTITKEPLLANPIVNLPLAEIGEGYDELEEPLSKIIDDINARMGTAFETDLVVKSILQIRDTLNKSDRLKNNAKANSFDHFEIAFEEVLSKDILPECYEQNMDFFGLLLNNEDARKEIVNMLSKDCYKHFRNTD